jgi:PAS domain S-box-containing protein
MPVQVSSINGDKKIATNTGYEGKPITEIVANGFFTVDRKWTVTYWNRAAEKLLRVEAKEIVGKNLWEKFAGIIPINFYSVYHKAFLQDIPIHFREYWAELGSWFDVITYHCDDTLSVSFKSVNGVADPYLPDAGKNQEYQFKDLNGLYRFITEVTNDCLWEWNLQDREIFWIDGGHKRVFGYQVENALVPQSFWESRIHPDDRDLVMARLNKIITEDRSAAWEEEYRFRKADGTFAYVHDRGQIIYNTDNIATRMIGATLDVTARKLTEMQLVESERKLSLIAKQTVNALIITDAEGKITWVNNSFSHLTEYKAEEIIGKELGIFLECKETDLVMLKYLRDQIKNKLPFNCDILNYTKSGRKYWMYVQGQPLLDENGKYDQYFVIETDITEKVLLEKKLADEKNTKQREITAAVLMAQEIERSNIGKELHDNLGQVLIVARLYAQMAKKNEATREMYLDKIAEYIGNVIEEIRRISRILVIPAKDIIGLFDSIKNLLKELSAIHPTKIEFHNHGIYEEDLDEKLQLTIYRIIQEQSNNIIKHANATEANINLTREGSQITLNIADNGQGCDMLELKSGLGLMNIRSRAEIYQGKVTLGNHPGKGFTLNVKFPLPTAILSSNS